MPPDTSQLVYSLLQTSSQYVVGIRKSGPFFAYMQPDGNFVLYNGLNPGHYNSPYFATGTNGWGNPLHLILNRTDLQLWDDSGSNPWGT